MTRRDGGKSGSYSRELDVTQRREVAGFFGDIKVAEGVIKKRAAQECSSQRFMSKLKSFALLCPWIEELNPEEVQNAQGRIVRRDPSNPNSSPVEMIYMKKKPNAPVSGVVQGNLFEPGGTGPAPY